MKQIILDKLSKHLCAALRQAAELAASFGHQSIEPLHLLAGLARVNGALSRELLEQTKLDVTALDDFLKNTIPMSNAPAVFSPASQGLIVKAALLAHRAHH